MEKTKHQLRDEADMLQFKVDRLWELVLDYRARLTQLQHSSRESSKLKQAIIDELKETNEQTWNLLLSVYGETTISDNTACYCVGTYRAIQEEIERRKIT